MLVVDAQRAAQHPHLARRQAVVAAPVVAERFVVAREREAGDRRAQPEIEVLVGAQHLVEAADGVVDAAAEHRHDEHRELIGQDREEVRRRTRVGPRA